MRKIAREVAFMLIYEEQFNKNLDVEFSFNFLKNEKDIIGENIIELEDENFARELINQYRINKEDIVEIVNRDLFGYEPSRVFKIDSALLYLAVAEIYYVKTPAPVVINEVVELAKKYSTDKSSKFINGILGAIIKRQTPPQEV